MNDKDFVMGERPNHPPFHPVPPPPPRVLVADDDASSCRFLGDGLRSLGAAVETCTNGHAAFTLARKESFDLLLLDCRMPEGGALHVLTQLRGDAQAASAESAAVASSAELTADDRRHLLAAGFSEVLLKPCTLADLQRVLSIAHGDRQSCVLDDGAALYSSGDPTTMRALRLLLREELALLQRELDGLGRDRAAFADRLHRLRSSCGFCGATALARQTVLMQQHLSRDGATPAALAGFHKAIQATLQALDE
jgi:CheY-like chemotaxis protein